LISLAGAAQFSIDLLFTTVILALLIYATFYYLTAFGTLLLHKPESAARPLSNYPSVSVIIPMHNEELTVASTLQAVSMADYPSSKLEVIVVDDASTDDTASLLDGLVGSFPFSFKVIHRDSKLGRGKAGAVNDGILASAGDVVVMFDGDHRPEPQCIRLLVARLEESGPKVGAVQGRTVYINEDENFITKVVSKVRDAGFMVYLEAAAAFGLPIYVAGSTTAFRREVFREVGLFTEGCITEDTDLSTRLYLRGLRVIPEIEAKSYEEAVNKFSAIRTRTYRWSRGHDGVLFKYWKEVLKSEYLPRKDKLYLELYLAYYAIPALTLMGIGIFALSFFIPLHAFFIDWSGSSWLVFSVFYFAYCFLAIPAFYAVGLYLAKRPYRDLLYIVFHIVNAFIDLWVCTKALVDETLGRKYVWVKTPRSGVITKKEPMDWLTQT
jgi:cellulose synthase/poly-beta-1,6-N-acetylglucosamine synthase-like glycosyltransferase